MPPELPKFASAPRHAFSAMSAGSHGFAYGARSSERKATGAHWRDCRSERFIAQVALPSAAALPIKIGDSKLLPACANDFDFAAEARGNGSVGVCSQDGIFFRRPGTPMREFDGKAKPAAAVRDSRDGQSQTMGQFAISHRAQQGVGFAGPEIEFGIRFWNLELDAASLYGRSSAPKLPG